MRIKLVSLEDGITSCGFRKMAAYVAQINEDTLPYYVSTNRYRSIRAGLRGTLGEAGDLGDTEVDEIAHDLADADIVGYSSMTGYAGLTRQDHQPAARDLAADLPGLGRNSPDHPPRGRDPGRYRRHLHRRG